MPGNPNRAVPNYVAGCLYDAHWDIPILTIPGHGGGADWNHQSFSHSTGLVYTGMGYVAAAHSLTEASNGLRPPGEYQTGAVVAVDPGTNLVRWKKHMPYSLAHGNGILTTASDLLFIGQPDGNLIAMDAHDGRELWRFQTGAAISASPVSLRDRRRAVRRRLRGRHRHPVRQLRAARRLPVGLQARAARCRRRRRRRRRWCAGRCRATRSRAHRCRRRTRCSWRARRRRRTSPGTTESTAVNGMTPTWMTRAGGNDGDVHQSRQQRRTSHCATQFFEGLFNFRLAPGQSAQYTFNTPGEYFYNDCFSPRPTGKIVVN